MKDFHSALIDGFLHITEITDPERLKRMREEGILVDSEGYYVFTFGDSKEYDLSIEPIGEEHEWLVALYKNGVLLTEKLHVWSQKKKK